MLVKLFQRGCLRISLINQVFTHLQHQITILKCLSVQNLQQNFQISQLPVNKDHKFNPSTKIIQDAILQVSTHRRKRTKLKKAKLKQKRKKTRRLSDAKKRKLNIL